MNMTDVVFHPVYSLARESFDEPGFDVNLLPMRITDTVTLEDISGLLSDDSFETWKRFIGSPEMQHLGRIKVALVRRFDSSHSNFTKEEDLSEEVEEVMACLRLIRPMREYLGLLKGRLKSDDSIELSSFTSPYSVFEVPEVEKLFT